MRLVSRMPIEENDRIETPQTGPEPEQIGMRELREFLARPQLEQTARDLLSILDHFVDVESYDSERDDGCAYLFEVLTESPNSSREVETLRCAGDAGQSQLEELREHVGRQLSQACVSEDVRQELNGWAQSLTAQRRHENRLVNESLNRDSGGES